MANRLFGWAIAGVFVLVLAEALRRSATTYTLPSFAEVRRLEAAIAAAAAEDDVDDLDRWRDVVGVVALVGAGVVLLGKLLRWWP